MLNQPACVIDNSCNCNNWLNDIYNNDARPFLREVWQIFVQRSPPQAQTFPPPLPLSINFKFQKNVEIKYTLHRAVFV